ncbi:conserved protein of unknown function precursor containing a type A C-terminal secretion signal. Probable M12B family metalloprotease [Tenacibaculum sp. 190130A14a]|uniref:DUF5011 domain-containing protein n=1 Tax=Tenacibaculum polynesiense TaxID=3137857 RepID=A0ABM9P741_9FLAO
MKNKLFLAMSLATSVLFSQNSELWKKQENVKVKASNAALQKRLPDKKIYQLDLKAFKQALTNAPERNVGKRSNVIISFPNAEGIMEKYRITEASVLHPSLSKKYPDIKSYMGVGVDDPSDRIRFSLSNAKGLQSMRLGIDKPTVFIEPYSDDLKKYTIYKRSDKPREVDGFKCDVDPNNRSKSTGSSSSFKNADDGILRTYRIAISATGEYTAHHGGTKAQALAAMNTTMTRVNGIYEMDFNLTMIIIANNEDVIYTNASTDPYSNGSFNSQVQSTLTSVIGEANYDIGHLFAKASNNGNAGCIGCVCVNGSKGSAFTSRTTPEGDPFDVDYVAHEIGHQFGGNHTFTIRNEGTNVHMEPGSGTTIMGYAGITGATDVQSNSDPYFHAITIQQITNYIKTTSCQTNTSTGNNVPTVNAGSDYTIPKGTAFVLTGTANDADASDVLSYCWEQMDENNAATTYPSVTATAGVAFRSYSPTTNASRYFPRLETIKTGSTSWQWEAVPNVARSLNFRLTVRDNRAGGGTNNSDDMVVTVNGTAGPFVVNSPNTNVTLSAGATETVTWDVAGTTANGVNAANVDILMSTDGGDTYPVVLASGVPNDGSHDITVPNSVGNQNRIMVKGTNHIFFDISNTNFTISSPQPCTATVPTGVGVGSVTASGAIVSWNTVSGATYTVEYKKVSDASWTSSNTSGTSTTLSGLDASTNYEVRVKSVCTDGTSSNFSTAVNFTTTNVQLVYCTANSTNVNDEYISNVKLNTIDNTSTGQFYSDFTNISTTITKGASETITITPTWTGTVYSEGYGVWIDYNKNGVFTDAGELVWSKAASTDTPVSGSFTVPASAVTGDTRMRVILRYNAIPSPCGEFTYGEVEDYTVTIADAGADTVAPVISLLGDSVVSISVGDTYTDAGATASDNVDGDISSNIVVSGSVDTNTQGTYILTYNVSDAAGNAATAVTRTVNVNAVVAGCTGGIGSYPYTESFDSSFGQWTQAGGDDLDWSRRTGGTPSNNTGPSAATNGSHYIYVEASGRNTGYPNKRAIINSPCFDLSGLSAASVSFQYHMYGATDMGTIDLEISEDDGATWTSIWNQSGNKGNSWLSASVDLGSYIGKGIKLRFNRFTGSTWRADIAIDAFELNSTSASAIGRAETIPSVELGIYPNPVVYNKIKLIKPVGMKSADYTIYNILGQEVKKGTATDYIDVSKLKTAMYTIIFKEEDDLRSIKFVKK